MTRPRAALISITSEAATHVKQLLADRDKPAVGIRVSLKTKGCSGLAYALDYVDTPDSADEVVSAHGVTVYVDPKAVLFLAGTIMDYTDDPLAPGFQFNNPNAKGHCGCGESFHT